MKTKTRVHAGGTILGNHGLRVKSGARAGGSTLANLHARIADGRLGGVEIVQVVSSRPETRGRVVRKVSETGVSDALVEAHPTAKPRMFREIVRN